MAIPDRAALQAYVKRNQLDSDAALFVVRLFIIYGFWKVFFYIAHRPDWPLYDWWRTFTFSVGSVYAHSVAGFMSGFEQHVSVHGTVIYLWACSMEVAEHCLGLPAMFLFSMSILLFRGVWWQKLLFIIAGLAGIILINLIRIFFVVEAFMRLSRYFYHMHHSLIYVVLTYGFILLMINWWMKKNAVKPNAIVDHRALANSFVVKES